MRIVHFWLVLLLSVLLAGCEIISVQDHNENPQAYWFSNSYTSFWPDGDSTCFRADDGLYRWQPEEERVTCIADGLFDSAELVYLAAVDGDYFYTQRLDPYLHRIDGETGETSVLAEITNTTGHTAFGYNGEMWAYDGMLYCLASACGEQSEEDHVCQMEVQVRDTGGQLVKTYPLPGGDQVSLVMARGEQLFLVRWGSAAEESGQNGLRVLDLPSGEEEPLPGAENCALQGAVGDRLLVLDTEEDTYWLLDAEGNRTPLAASCETVLASDGAVTYGKNSGVLVRETDDGVEALATCRGYISDCCLIDGVFYLNQGLDLWVREDRLRFADATGENAEMVEKVNAAGSLQGGRKLTLAFMPDGTVYLLHCS